MTEERAKAALRASFERFGYSADDWRVKAVHKSQPGLFDLLPPRPGALSVKEAWDLTYSLIDRPSVVDAEPSFEILQDNADALSFVAEEEPLIGAGGPPVFSKETSDWCPRLISALDAWQLDPQPFADTFPLGKKRGEGILIGHPDSGYRRHPEILDELEGRPNRFLAELGRDFIDGDDITEDPDGGHGLGTASVLMSFDDQLGAKFVTGIAPAAQIIPYRVTKPHLFIPAPVLFRSGMLRLADAIFRAVDQGCHVISISLGWLPNDKVQKAVKYAFEHDVIVVAAAGNSIRILVVWPAHYDEVISCAGCTSHRRRWSGSSRGKRVDVTGPAEHVWKAAIDDTGNPNVEPSDGTSFAAASTAGVAALWLAFWGRDRLLDRYKGEFRLTTIFRKLLTDSCDPPPEGANGDFGKGIVNACRLLESALPSREELRASVTPIMDAVAMVAPETTVLGGFGLLSRVFDDVPRAELRKKLSGIMETNEDELESNLQGVGRELAFHVLTTPSLREEVLTSREPAPSNLLGAAAEVESTTAFEATRKRLLESSLSERLRSRIGSV